MRSLTSFIICLAVATAEDVRLVDLEPNEASQLIEQQDQTLKYAPKIESNVPALRFLGKEQHQVLEDIYLANQYHGQDGLGGYLYGYSVPDIAKTEKKKAGGDLKGAYNYINGDGKEIKVEYWDDGTGFHQVDNVDQIYPPVEDTPEVKAAKEEHLRIWQEQAERNSHAPEDPNANIQQQQGQQSFGGYRGSIGAGQPTGQYQGGQSQISGQYQSGVQSQGGQYQAGGQYKPTGGQLQAGGQYKPIGQQQAGGQFQTGGQYKPVGQQQASGQFQAGGQYKPGGLQQAGGQLQAGGLQQAGGQFQAGGQYKPGGQQQSSGQLQAGGQYIPGGQQQAAGQFQAGGQYKPSGQQQAGGQYQGGFQQQTGGQYQAGGQIKPSGQSQILTGGQIHVPGYGQAAAAAQSQFKASGQIGSSGYQAQGSLGQSLNNLEYSGQYSENKQIYAQNPSGKIEGEEEEQGPPRGFFYKFDYPVGIIVQKDGGSIQKREDVGDLYNKNKESIEKQLQAHGDYRLTRSATNYPNYFYVGH